MQRIEPARHERPVIDEAALLAARDAEKILDEVRARGHERWIRFFEPVPELLRDTGIKDLRGVAMKARSAFGPKDSIRDAAPRDLTEPFLVDLDRLLKALARDLAEH
jgi:hypothetical protein